MTPQQIEILRTLFTQVRVLSLGVLVEGQPVVGLLPFVARPDFGGLLVRASRLARHTRGLVTGAPFGALIHLEDSPEGDPLQIVRVSLDGTVEELRDGSPSHGDAERLYRARFPSAEMTFALPDFSFYDLRIEGGRLVAGFGGAINLSRAALVGAAPSKT
jgi:hypothetical protein